MLVHQRVVCLYFFFDFSKKTEKQLQEVIHFHHHFPGVSVIFPSFSPWFSRCFHHFTMIFPWFSRCFRHFPMIFPVFPSFSHDFHHDFAHRRVLKRWCLRATSWRCPRWFATGGPSRPWASTPSWRGWRGWMGLPESAWGIFGWEDSHFSELDTFLPFFFMAVTGPGTKSNWSIRRKWWSEVLKTSSRPLGFKISTDIPWTSWLFFSIENHDISWWCFIPPTRQELPVHKFEVLHAEDGCSDVWTARVASQEFCPKPLLSTFLYNFVCFLLCIFLSSRKTMENTTSIQHQIQWSRTLLFFCFLFWPVVIWYGNIWEYMWEYMGWYGSCGSRFGNIPATLRWFLKLYPKLGATIITSPQMLKYHSPRNPVGVIFFFMCWSH